MKDITHYKQHWSTCVVCCVLMVLESFGIIDKSRKYYEKKIFEKLRSKYMEGVPFSAAAWYLAKEGIKCELFHSEKNYFNNDSNYMNNADFNFLIDEYKTWCEFSCERGVKVVNGCTLDSKTLKSIVNKNKLVILAGMVDNVLHAILLEKCVENEFVVCDPLLEDKSLMGMQEIEKFMNTPIGKWCIGVEI